MRRIFLLGVSLLALASCSTTRNGVQTATRVFDVREFGAVGDGQAKETVAVQQALDACAAKGGGEVRFPAGKYVTGSVIVGSNTTVRLEDGATLVGSPDSSDYPIERVRWEGRWRDGHRALVSMKDAKNVAIAGPGAIEGPPFAVANLRNPRGPCLIEPVDCTGVRLEGFSTNYRRMWSIHLTRCENVTAANLHIRSEPKPSNGDGIDVDSCSHVTISRCDIDTGDDAIALKSGRGTEGYTEARPTRDVTISDCRLGSSFAGLAMGSEMSGGVLNVVVRRCTFTRGSNGIYIKSRVGRGGVMRDIDCADLVGEGPKCFLRIDLVARGLQDESPVQGPQGIPELVGVRIANVRSTCDSFCEATKVNPEKPVTNLTIEDVTGTCRRPIAISHARDVVLKHIRLTGVNGPLFRLEDVTGPNLPQLSSTEEP